MKETYLFQTIKSVEFSYNHLSQQ